MKVGIKETKELVVFICELGNSTGRALADGKISFADLWEYMPAFMKAGDAFEGANTIPGELKDLDEAEQAELLAFVQDKFDIPQDNVEVVVERALEIGMTLYKFIKEFFSK